MVAVGFGYTNGETDMANIRYFAGLTELSAVRHNGSPYTSAKHFTGLDQAGNRVRVERAIERKRNPSMHKCDARCLHATGFRCECECGGKNHGAGKLACAA